MKIAIHRSILGTERSLVHDRESGEFSWVNKIPCDTWVCGDRDADMDILSLAKVLGQDIKTGPGERYEAPWSVLRKSCVEGLPWMHVLPSRVFKRYIQSLLDQLWLLLDQCPDGYYVDELLVCRKLILSLSRAKVNVDKFAEIMNHGRGEKSSDTLRKFSPDALGYAPRTRYCQGSSVTGRLTVADGPNILILRKAHRTIFESRYNGGSIMQVDLVSLEPRVLLSILGKDTPDDIYEYIGASVLGNKLSRDEAKSATLATLYGMSSSNLQKSLPDSIDAKNVLREIKRYFDISPLSRRLNKDHREKGYISNFYGRQIRANSASVNHFVQSSGVDASLLGFSNLMSDICEARINAVPIFVIHDAIIFDVEKDSLARLGEIVSDGIRIPGMNKIFPAKVEIIS